MPDRCARSLTPGRPTLRRDPPDARGDSLHDVARSRTPHTRDRPSAPNREDPPPSPALCPRSPSKLLPESAVGPTGPDRDEPTGRRSGTSAPVGQVRAPTALRIPGITVRAAWLGFTSLPSANPDPQRSVTARMSPGFPLTVASVPTTGSGVRSGRARAARAARRRAPSITRREARPCSSPRTPLGSTEAAGRASSNDGHREAKVTDSRPRGRPRAGS